MDQENFSRGESILNRIKEGDQYKSVKNEAKIKVFKKWIYKRVEQLEDENSNEISKEICELLFEKEV